MVSNFAKNLALFGGLLTSMFLILIGDTAARPPDSFVPPLAAPLGSEILDNRSWIDANRLLMFVTNKGSIAFDQGAFLGKNDGLYFPFISVNNILNGSQDKTVVFAGGIWIAAVDAATGNIVATVSEYSDEFSPGPLGTPFSNAAADPEYRVYKLYRDSLEANPNQDYLDWPVAQGAPVDNLGRPEIHGNQTMWSVFNDGEPSVHTNNATGPNGLDIEIQLTVWAFEEPVDIDTTPTPIVTVEHIAGPSLGSVSVDVINRTILTGHDYLVVFGTHSSLGPVWHLIDITIGDTVLLNQSVEKGSADGMHISIVNGKAGISHEYRSASPFNVSPIAIADNGYAGGDRWYTKGENASGGELLSGGIFMEPNFWGETTLDPSSYDTVEIRWRPMLSYTDLNGNGTYTPGEPFIVDDPSQTQKAFMYQSFTGSAYEGFFDVPFTAWDVSDPANHRQLNVVVRDRDADHAWNFSGKCEPPDCDTTNLPNGGDHRFNYTWILGTDYDPTGRMYGNGSRIGPDGGLDFFEGTQNGSSVRDAMWVLWLGERATIRGQLAEECITTLTPGAGNTMADTFAFSAPMPSNPSALRHEENALYLRYKIINTSTSQWNNMLVGLWFDPDIGDNFDDFVGCDSVDDVFFSYNGRPVDAVYGSRPPVFAGKLLEGPAVVSAADSAWINGVAVAGLRNLGMYAFTSFAGGDPNSSLQTYNYMNGFTRFGFYIHDPTTGWATRFWGSGDPVIGSGWLPRGFGDSKLLPVTGPFTLNPGDTQYVVWKVAVGQGADHLNSLTKAREILNKPVDSDGDGVAFYFDNCPDLFNPDQLDADGDGIGNVCDDSPIIVCGDVNGSGVITFKDLDFLIRFYFMFGDPPVSIEAADVNIDGIIDLSDIVFLAEYLNGIRPAPCASSEPPPGFDPKKKPEKLQISDQ